MAQPARRNAAGPEPDHPLAAVLDPRKLIWADVRHDLILWAETCAKQVAILASRPDDDAALEMARLCLAGLERAAGMASQWKVGEALLESEGQRRYDEGYAACKADRCRLGVNPGGAADPR
jgi:hypothetical protein